MSNDNKKPFEIKIDNDCITIKNAIKINDQYKGHFDWSDIYKVQKGNETCFLFVSEDGHFKMLFEKKDIVRVFVKNNKRIIGEVDPNAGVSLKAQAIRHYLEDLVILGSKKK